MKLTDVIKSDMIKAGLSKSQVDNKGFQMCFEYLTSDDGKIIIDEIQRQINELEKKTEDIKRMTKESETIFWELRKDKDNFSNLDERAKSAIALYTSMLQANKKYCEILHNSGGWAKSIFDMDKAIENASYVVYAYLGGQARRIYEAGFALDPQNKEVEDAT